MSFLRFLNKPLIKEAARVSALMSAGDIIAQTLVEKKAISDIDLIRTGKFAAIGCFFVGPTLKVWYGQLDRIVATQQKPLVRAVKKMSFDQFLFAPIFTAAFIVVMGKVNEESTAQIKRRFREDYPQIMLRNYMLWPAAQMINFGLVPLPYQVMFAQCVAIIWNTYLSLVLNKN